MDKICRKFDVNEIPTPYTLRIQIHDSLKNYQNHGYTRDLCLQINLEETLRPV